MWLRIPTGRRQTSWLFTSVGDYLNTGKPRKIPASGQIRAGLELATFGLQVQRSNHSTTLPRTHRVVTCHPLSCLPAKQFSIAVISSSAILNVREKEKCFTSFFVSQDVLWKTTRIYLYNKNTISVFYVSTFREEQEKYAKGPFPWLRSILWNPDHKTANQRSSLSLENCLPYNNHDRYFAFSVIALWILAGILTFLLLMACCYYCCWHVCCGRYVKKMWSIEFSGNLTTYPSLKSS